MSTRKAFLAAALGALGIAGVGTAIHAGQGGGPGSGPSAEQGWNHRGGGHGGWMRGRHGVHGMAFGCQRMAGDPLDGMVKLVDSFANFTPPQGEAWSRLVSSLQDARSAYRESCATLKADTGPGTAPDRLARTETMLAAGLAAVRRVRPSFDAFYATLSESQQAAVDGFMQHRRNH